ncbi:unnamed protein product [Clavelina lepadiformis]|uniref:NADH-ubiquinone oxidoreductase 21kDa subunit N-terminal domain-containing protein n=1 Tax=Clavelina lepadiformis TaxID=159417 RepID=A0ABP0H0Q6_CLALP
MPWFGEKGMPAMPHVFGTHYALTVNEFRKTSHPIEILNPASVVLGFIGGAAAPLSNHMSNLPLLLGGPRIVLGAAAGIWLGYYASRAHGQYYLGKFKYCLEYALSRSDRFPLKVPQKFSDPAILDHWQPVR